MSPVTSGDDPGQAAPYPPAFQLRIDLADQKPPVWRRVVVPSGFTFDDLHQVIQVVFEWEHADPHEFEVNGERIGDPKSREDPLGILGRALDGKSARLHEPLGPVGTDFRYVCDVAGGREHTVQLEAVVRDPQWPALPVLVAGRRVVAEAETTSTGREPQHFEVARLDKKLEPLRRRWAKRGRPTTT